MNFLAIASASVVGEVFKFQRSQRKIVQESWSEKESSSVKVLQKYLLKSTREAQ